MNYHLFDVKFDISSAEGFRLDWFTEIRWQLRRQFDDFDDLGHLLGVGKVIFSCTQTLDQYNQWSFEQTGSLASI